MPYLYKTGHQYGNSTVNIIGKACLEVTQAQYDALSYAEKNDGTIYFVKDGTPESLIVNDSSPIGAIQAYGGDTAPDGWLICAGQAISRTTYTELFAVIGTTYGIGDGNTTFNVPDFRGNVAIGASATYDLGDSGGEAIHALNQSEIPNYDIGFMATVVPGSHSQWSNGGIIGAGGATGASQGKSGTIYMAGTANTQPQYGWTVKTNGGSQAHNNMQPYLVCNYIIKAKDTSTSETTLLSMIDYFYPVGSYYETSDTTFDPNTAFGGTWILETQGQVHISAGANYSVSGALTNTTDGGSKDAVVVSHTHKVSSGWQSASGQPDRITYGGVNGGYNNTGYGGVQFIESVGVSGTDKNLQPYIVVNRWHRTA